MVFLSASVSPRASTVIFCDRSPLATAVVTAAMFRTWLVRFPASVLTLSVRSFHVPATPGTSACPPSLPSVPTSRATRVTSLANEPSWSTIVLTVVPMRRNSPCTGLPSISSTIFWPRSPSATAVSTRATSVVGEARSVMSVLTDSTVERQPPVTGPTEARSFIWPWRPMVVLTRSISSDNRSLSFAIPLNASAISESSGSSDMASRTSNSPSLRSRMALSRRRRSTSLTLPSGASAPTSCSLPRLLPAPLPFPLPFRPLPPLLPFFRREPALEERSELSSVPVSSSIVSPISTTLLLDVSSLRPPPLAGSLNPRFAGSGPVGSLNPRFAGAGPVGVSSTVQKRGRSGGGPTQCHSVVGLTSTGSPKWISPSDSTRAYTRLHPG